MTNNDSLSPRPGHLFIRRALPETETAGGIHLCRWDRDTPHEGEIVAHGTLEYKGVSVGDTVIWTPNADEEGFELDGELLTIIAEDDLLAYSKSY